ncbi:MAG: glycerol kinase GlpK [Bacteroidales bacterium]|nr:glycerol kinase GlpK [Bacteroidales bacterium]
MQKYYLAIDQGTTSCRAVLFDENFNIGFKKQKEFRQIFPEIGWVEHDPMEILNTQMELVQQLIKEHRIPMEEIQSAGITNQRETVVLWDKQSGKPVYNAIVWQDTRTAQRCNLLKSTKYAKIIGQKTGLIIDPYFSASKIEWILKNVVEARELLAQGRLLFGTIDTWLCWNLTDGKVHTTDVSNASRTMLFNIHTLEWDDELLEVFNIPKEILPEIKNNVDDFGKTDFKTLCGVEIPITAMAGDQQASLFGHACFDKGNLKNTYGTGCFIMMNTGSGVVNSENGLLSTIAWKINNEITYALEGSVFIAGAAVQWLRDNMGLLETAAESEHIAKSVEDTAGTYFVPAFAGLGAPYWNTNAQGAYMGITRATRKEHLVRAVLESIAFQNKDVLEVMITDSNQLVKAIFVDGGASNNAFLMQFQADILGMNIQRSIIDETTAKGVAMMASMATGNTMEDFRKMNIHDKIYPPKMEDSKRKFLYKQWLKAVKTIDYQSFL